jgi:regulator of sirC expression with transglutaminase-like and TPR domain
MPDGAGIPSFAALAARADAPLDELALSIAVELRGIGGDAVRGALERLDALGAELAAELADRAAAGADAEASACADVLGDRHGFAGDAEQYDDPANSMLDLVLERRRGLPILLSVVYAEVARRAGVALAGVGLPGHYVVGHFGASPPLLLDPFAGGAPVAGEAPAEHVRPWGAHETALRMLNNLVGSYQRRGDVGSAIAAAAMRLELPLHRRLRDALETDLRRIRARLN